VVGGESVITGPTVGFLQESTHVGGVHHAILDVGIQSGL